MTRFSLESLTLYARTTGRLRGAFSYVFLHGELPWEVINRASRPRTNSKTGTSVCGLPEEKFNFPGRATPTNSKLYANIF